jgi:hypothetical protein
LSFILTIQLFHIPIVLGHPGVLIDFLFLELLLRALGVIKKTVTVPARFKGAILLSNEN